ncbi:LLM class flavin-dependent oxidoreductase [Enemella evansiae]|uniref:LLM class flavin-dependent oxidoreductase n=1 Tax=Enemella evansiae TaxID=2016499 RepID=UPI001E4297E9|nr:LLM class flavin-dependent oxidoreductase [Enemella evansiae]
MNVTTARPMELGIYSFGELTDNPRAGQARDAHERIGQLLDHARIADQGGLDIFALGEHHRHDFAVSAPEVVLGAIATATSRIRLASGVTVLSSQDPVRVFQQFATLDQVSDGRAEIWAGRGAFTESFPLFGYQLNDYDELFEEKLELLLRLRDEPTITWSGNRRPAISAGEISPRPVQDPLPVWVAIGGTPASAVRAGLLGLPMMMGFFAGPEQFVPRVELYHRAAARAGHDPSSLRLGVSGHMYVGKTSQGARDDFFPHYARYFEEAGRRLGSGGFPRSVYDSWIEASLPVGSPQQVIEAILTRVELLGIDRFIGQFDVGNLPREMTRESLELYLTEVVPVIRRETAGVAA